MQSTTQFGYLWRQLLLRDLRARYKQTAFGVAWGVGRPLVELAVYVAVFGAVLRVPSDGVPYPLFAYVGIVVWTFISSGIPRATASLTTHGALVSALPFPKATIPLASVGVAMVDSLLSAVLLGVALIIYGAPFGFHLVLLVPIGVILVAFVAGLGLLLSTLNVFYRDFTHLIQLVVRVWLFLTPVVYAASAVPERFRPFYQLNPLVGIFEGVRAVVIHGSPPDWSALAYPAAVAVGVLAISVAVFRRAEPLFAETV
jgi:lipopolysaccharide transport system permease protein